MSKVVVENVTFSHVHVFQAKANKQGILKFSSAILIDKTNKTAVAAVKAAIDAAVAEGIAKGYFTAAMKSIIKLPLRDGDAELASEQKSGDEYKGRLFFNANANDTSPPGVVKPENGIAVPIKDPLEFYSGCKGHVSISFYPFKTQDGTAKGVAAGLNGCYKLADGDRLDGRENTASVFADHAEVDSANQDDTLTDPVLPLVGLVNQQIDPFS